MDRCPKCGGRNIHASRARSIWDRWRKSISRKRPHRCPTCGWRGWADVTAPKFDEQNVKDFARAIASEPPDLKETFFARRDETRTIDLKELDRPATDPTTPEPAKKP
jgi:hypothetical protein